MQDGSFASKLQAATGGRTDAAPAPETAAEAAPALGTHPAEAASVTSDAVETAPVAEAGAQSEGEAQASLEAGDAPKSEQSPRPDRGPRPERGPRPQGTKPPGGAPREAKPPGGTPQAQQRQSPAPGGAGPQGGRDSRPPRRDGGPGGDRRDDRGGPRGGPGGRPDFLQPDIELEKLIADSLYLDNQAHVIVSRMRDMDSGTKSQLRRLYNAVRRAVRAADSERQHEFVMLRARLAYTIARHSLRSLDALERLLLQVTRKNDVKGYERFRDLFEAIVAYNE